MYSPSRTGVFELHPLTFIVTLLSKKQKCNLQSSDSRRICPDVMVMFPFSFSFFCASGLSAPVPRGRKGKKLKNQLNVPELKNADWLVHCNPEVVLQDESYKKHLKQHCNKSV